MIAEIQYYCIRGLWSVMGLGTMAIAAVPENFWQKVFVFLCGLITLMLSILLGGFIKHLSNHSEDREKLFEVLEEKYMRKDLCESEKESMKESLKRIEDKLGCKK